MTQPTSSRSAKAIPKTAVKRATNGTPPEPTEPESEPISGVTEWTLEMGDGTRKRVRVLGSSNGRVSVGGLDRHGREVHEVRIYRNQSIKGYEAYISGVRNVWSQNVLVDDLGKPPEIAKVEAASRAKLEARRERMAKDRFEAVIKGVLANSGYGVPPDEDPEFTEPEEFEAEEEDLPEPLPTKSLT